MNRVQRRTRRFVSVAIVALLSASAMACDDEKSAGCPNYTLAADGSCVDLCPAGTAAETLLSCVACTAGRFAASAGASSCAAHATCAPGTYQTAAGTATTDTVCQACPSGTHASTPGASSCTTNQTCTAGTFVASPGSATEDRTCSPCATGSFSSSSDAATCTTHTTCDAGAYAATAGTATADTVCMPCASGSFSASAGATSCTAWTECAAGTYVSTPGTATSDQACSPCAAGTFTSGPNQSTCLPHTACPAGTVQVGTEPLDMPLDCQACEAGTYCMGGTFPPIPCTDMDDTWDHDGDAATACVQRSICVAGTYTSSQGNVTTDRVCTPCDPGTYTDGSGYTFCLPHTSCSFGTVEVAPPTSTSNRVCATSTLIPDVSSPGSLDPVEAIATDLAGDIYVAGYTTDGLAGMTVDGLSDAFVAKYGPLGNLLWERQLGSAELDVARAVAVDSSTGMVYVTGRTDGALPGHTSAGMSDVFVAAYTSDGTLAWSTQFGSEFEDEGYDLATTQDGDVVVVGDADGTVGAASPGGPNPDIIVRSYTAAGVLNWSTQFGSATAEANPSIATLGAQVVVTGQTYGTLAGQTTLGGIDNFLVSLAETDGALGFTTQFGTAMDEARAYVDVYGSGYVVVSSTEGAVPGYVNATGYDAYATFVSTSGAITSQVQWQGDASVLVFGAETIDTTGEVAIGVYSADAMASPNRGGFDIGLLLYQDAPSPTISTISDFGTSGTDVGYGLVVQQNGRVLVAGTTFGAFPGNLTTGRPDGYVYTQYY